MEVVKRVADLQQAIARRQGTIGLVPTMGALHAGHASLVERCRKECDVVVVSVFVNPTQFNDKNDLTNYPRTPEADLALLETAGADIVFMPEVEDIYPEEDTRVFDFGALAQVMEGAQRPGHFNGVGQVVSRLFVLVNPDKAYFGEKDFQQLAIIRLLVEQLGMNIEIIGCPIKRADDGLALSSRNALLNPAQRAAAPLICKTLSEAAGLTATMSIEELIRWVISRVDANPELKTEYFAVTDARTLQSVSSWDESDDIRGFITVQVGRVRLIDNIKLR